MVNTTNPFRCLPTYALGRSINISNILKSFGGVTVKKTSIHGSLGCHTRLTDSLSVDGARVRPENRPCLQREVLKRKYGRHAVRHAEDKAGNKGYRELGRPRVPPRVPPKLPPRVPPNVPLRVTPRVPPRVPPKVPPRVPPKVLPRSRPGSTGSSCRVRGSEENVHIDLNVRFIVRH